MIDYVEMITKLLAKAEGATTDEERAIYQQKAQSLATNYSIDLAKARHMLRNKQQTKPEQREIVIGVRGTEGLRTLQSLYCGIARANDLRCLISPSGSRVYPVGFPEDIDITNALYASLVTQMTTAVEEYKTEGSWRGEKVWTEVWKNGYSDGGAYRSINWRTARLSFQEGFTDRVTARLAEAKLAAKRDRIMAERAAAEQTADEPESVDSNEPGTELVLASKKQQVDEFYDRIPKGRATSNSNSNVSSGGARRAGAAAANRASISGRGSLPGARRGIQR